MDNTPPTVFVVDDNTAVRRSLRWLVESIGLGVETYASAQEFLAAYQPERPGCLVVDVRMPGISGPELQEQLVARGSTLPVIFVTGYGDVATAVRTLKLGAEDFIQKPFSNQVLLDRVQHAMKVDAERRQVQTEIAALRARLARLTSREREVADLVASGRPSKLIASELGVTEKTVEFHRANIMTKLGVHSLADLLRIVLRAQWVESERGHSSERPRY
jgi:FixJ family two-component response regulator